MIALVVLLFVSLALMQTALVSISANMKNNVRNAAVSIAEDRMNEVRSYTWANIQSDPATTAITLASCQDEQECLCQTGQGCTGTGYDSDYPDEKDRSFRNITIPFGTRLVVTTMPNGFDKQVTIVVRGVYKDKCYSYVTSTIVGQQ